MAIATASRLTRKYQNTIPAEMRCVLRLKEGDTVQFEIEEDRVTLRARRHRIEHTSAACKRHCPNGTRRTIKRRMAIFEPWSVVVVPFPFIDRRQTKRRRT